VVKYLWLLIGLGLVAASGYGFYKSNDRLAVWAGADFLGWLLVSKILRSSVRR
jgi:hypothetical protein